MIKKPVSPKINIEDLKSEIGNLKSSLARALADYANLERRFTEQSSSVIKFANASLLTQLIDLRDHLEMASVHLQDSSLKLILNSLDKLLSEEGVTEIKAMGVYDPATMECQELGEGPKDQIIKVIRPGYRLHDRVLRTSRVVVGSGATVPQDQTLQDTLKPEGKA